MNYRGIRPASIVYVLEGDGSVEHPYIQVEYVVVFKSICGIEKQVTLGKITPLSEQEKNSFDTA